MDYDLKLSYIIKEIRKQKAKLVCIQLPDGLKPYAKHIADKIRLNTSAKVVIWLGSCFGACDIPYLNKVDLLIQFGHEKK